MQTGVGANASKSSRTRRMAESNMSLSACGRGTLRSSAWEEEDSMRDFMDSANSRHSL